MNKKVQSILFISSVILVGCSSQSPTYSEQLEAPTPKELIPEANRLIEEGKINAALEKILPYAQRGTSDGRAEGVAGYIYSNELKDVAEAMKWYKKSAKKGNAISLYNLGNIYYDMQDYDQAYDCYEKSAKLNDPQAITMLGVLYYYGNGVSRDYRKSVDYFKKGVEHGDKRAYYYLGISYMESHGVPQNLGKAKELLNKAKELGVNGAESKLAELE